MEVVPRVTEVGSGSFKVDYTPTVAGMPVMIVVLFCCNILSR